MLLVVEEGGANPVALELRSTDVKSYDENHIISPKERRELRAKYVEALFAGISAGKDRIVYMSDRVKPKQDKIVAVVGCHKQLFVLNM